MLDTRYSAVDARGNNGRGEVVIIGNSGVFGQIVRKD